VKLERWFRRRRLQKRWNAVPLAQRDSRLTLCANTFSHAPAASVQLDWCLQVCVGRQLWNVSGGCGWRMLSCFEEGEGRMPGTDGDCKWCEMKSPDSAVPLVFWPFTPVRISDSYRRPTCLFHAFVRTICYRKDTKYEKVLKVNVICCPWPLYFWPWTLYSQSSVIGSTTPPNLRILIRPFLVEFWRHNRNRLFHFTFLLFNVYMAPVTIKCCFEGDFYYQGHKSWKFENEIWWGYRANITGEQVFFIIDFRHPIEFRHEST